MKVLGIDPGTIHAGWGVVTLQGNRLVGVDAGVLNLGSKQPLPVRLKRLDEGLRAVVAETQPQAMAVEEVFFAKHPNAALKLGHARGVALLAGAQAGLAIHEYPPALVKQTVTGRGNAAKDQVAKLVGVMLGWQERLADAPSDATDALAIAITHLQARRLHGALPTAPKRGKLPLHYRKRLKAAR